MNWGAQLLTFVLRAFQVRVAALECVFACLLSMENSHRPAFKEVIPLIFQVLCLLLQMAPSIVWVLVSCVLLAVGLTRSVLSSGCVEFGEVLQRWRR